MATGLHTTVHHNCWLVNNGSTTKCLSATWQNITVAQVLKSYKENSVTHSVYVQTSMLKWANVCFDCFGGRILILKHQVAFRLCGWNFCSYFSYSPYYWLFSLLFGWIKTDLIFSTDFTVQCADSRWRVGAHGHDSTHKDQGSNDCRRQQPGCVETCMDIKRH